MLAASLMQPTCVPQKLALLIAIASSALASTASAQDLAPRSPPTAQLDIGYSVPHQTFRAGVGVHGWWRDYLDWGARVQMSWTEGEVDLSGDARNDYDAGSDGPNFEASFDVGIPLTWQLSSGLTIIHYGRRFQAATDFGAVTQLSLISGARLALTGARDFAIPLGLRWSKHGVLPKGFGEAYRETWFQIRALAFSAGRLGVDAEVAWMPWSWVSLVAYAEIMPTLHDAPANRQCTILPGQQMCVVDYPVNSFNPIAELPYHQLGLMLRVTAAQ